MLNIGTFARWSQKHIVPTVGGLAPLVVLLLGFPAEASVNLTRADVEALRNRVEILIRGRAARSARRSDVLSVGDALRTAAASQADLRFNDGSLARVGERATFRFVPNTRSFSLSNGTMLLLIPPGQGRTNIQTPSAVTGIQGSAVVVRYVPATDLTVIMALTNNPSGPMTVTSSSCSGGGGEAIATAAPKAAGQGGAIAQTKNNSSSDGESACGTQTEYSLYAGQMALIQADQVEIVEFDLPTFYQTSPLVEGLELDNPDAESPLGPVLEQVRAETLEALAGQSPFAEGVTLTPELIGLDGHTPAANDSSWGLSPTTSGVSPLTTLRGLLSPENTLVNAVPPVQSPGIPSSQPPAVSGSSPIPPTSSSGNSPSRPAPTPVGTPRPTPVTPVPVTPTPVTPVTPAPVTPTPVTPAPVIPVTPAPVTPAPVTPTPVTPTPVTPAPVTPTPVTPAPVTPAPVIPVTPAPVTPAPVTPTPVTPAPVIPVTPAPVTPAPVTPTPVTPAPVIPVTPAPVTPAPVIPVTPAPVTPAPVIPVTPVTPAPVIPVTPVTPDPVIPVTPTPVTPGTPVTGPGNAQPPPFNGGVPANPPATPEPFFPTK